MFTCQHYVWLIQGELLKQVQTSLPLWDHPGMHLSVNQKIGL